MSQGEGREGDAPYLRVVKHLIQQEMVAMQQQGVGPPHLLPGVPWVEYPSPPASPQESHPSSSSASPPHTECAHTPPSVAQQERQRLWALMHHLLSGEEDALGEVCRIYQEEQETEESMDVEEGEMCGDEG